jgi:hypothetical protein
MILLDTAFGFWHATVPMSPRQFHRQHKIEKDKLLSATVRKHLSADALIRSIRSSFEQVGETRKRKPDILMEDALMSAYAMFSLKDASLLAFEKRQKAEEHNLKAIYKLKTVPSDTQMRTILDPAPPDELRPAHNAVLRAVQRGKALEKMVYLEEGYLMPLDGTGYFSSEKLFSPACLQKIRSSGKITYHLQMLGAALVHPECKEVIPLIPEIISRQDGTEKNDCEINASKRFLAKFHRDHPHLKIVVTQDAIAPNGPYIRFVKDLGYHFIITVKEADHAHLFAQLDRAVENNAAPEMETRDLKDSKKFHYFRWVNGLSINASHPDILVNVLEYWQVTGEVAKRFCWVTDIPLNQDNVYRIMRTGRARWKIENETFNTLKNQGYNFEHNYGLGKQNLSTVFVKLMMLAFLVDQVQQLCCGLFQAVLKKEGGKKYLWEAIRSAFRWLKAESMEMLYLALLSGNTGPPVTDST